MCVEQRQRKLAWLNLYHTAMVFRQEVTGLGALVGASEDPWFRVQGLGFRGLGFQGFRALGFQGKRASGFQGFRVSGYQGFGV